MYHTTGFSKDEIADLCALVNATDTSSDGDDYPPVVGLFKSVAVTLTYLRRNHVQQELAEYYAAISQAITAITSALARVTRRFTLTAEELPCDEQLIVDGTLVSCWSWDDHPELHSGKHHTTGLNIQVVCDLAGRLRWISDPVDSCRHDSAALRLPGALDDVETQNWIGDKDSDAAARRSRADKNAPPAPSAPPAPISDQLRRPRHDHSHQKPPHRELLDWEKEANTAINKIRWRIE